MSLPTFRFIDAGETAALDDGEFWRDVEASDRLASPIKANLYLRELCRTKATEDARLSLQIERASSQEGRERALLDEVFARGYRLFGSDVGSFAGTYRTQAEARPA